MKKFISLFAALLMVVFSVFPSISILVNAADTIGNISTSPIEPIAPEKIICNATIDDNFADDSLIVVLKKDANPTFKTMSAADFSEIEAKDKYMRSAGFGGGWVRGDDFINDGLCLEIFR